MKEYLINYLNHVGITEGIDAFDVACEICGCKEYVPFVDDVDVGQNTYAKLPVVSCAKCHYIFQNPRFCKKFYDDYYDKYYRLGLFDTALPENDFIYDQVKRGECIFQSISKYLPEKGRLLDVGCSAGGLMVPFLKRGWEALGTDPDSAYVNYGKKLGLDIRAQSAEDMELNNHYYDLTIITGSLEHVFDANAVLNVCHDACAENGLLLIEGRALNYGGIKGYLSHNHRRYLTIESTELFMLKHGWKPILSTSEPLAGSTRPGAIFVLGRKTTPIDSMILQEKISDISPGYLQGIKQRLSNIKGIIK